MMLQIGNIYSQYCVPFEIVETDFQVETKFVKVEAEWYPSWINISQHNNLFIHLIIGHLLVIKILNND